MSGSTRSTRRSRSTGTGSKPATSPVRPGHVRADARRRRPPAPPAYVRTPAGEPERVGGARPRRHPPRPADRQGRPQPAGRTAPALHRPRHGPATGRAVRELDRRRDARRAADRTGGRLDRDAADRGDRSEPQWLHGHDPEAERGARGRARLGSAHHAAHVGTVHHAARHRTSVRHREARARRRRSWPTRPIAAAAASPARPRRSQKTTVVFPWRSTRSSQCACTARASTVRSMSAPRCVSRATSSRWLTRVTSCSMIGPASSSSVT